MSGSRRPRRRAAAGVLCTLLLSAASAAQEAAPLGPYPGPTHRAFLIENTRHALRFEASLDGAEARAFVDQGFAQLHGGAWFEAERSFRQAASLQPSGAVAWLGAAMAAQADGYRARYFMENAVAWRERASARERLLIDAWARRYGVSRKDAERARAMRSRNVHEARRTSFERSDEERAAELRARLAELCEQDPADHELRALWLHLLHLDLRTGRIAEDQRQTAREAGLLAFDALPVRHPGRLHLLDHAAFLGIERGLRALKETAPFSITPVTTHGAAGRMLLRLRRASDALPHLEAAVRAGFAYLEREWTMPFLVDGFADAALGRAEALDRLGRVADAIDWHREIQELPRHPTLNCLADLDSFATRHLLQFLALCVEYELGTTLETAAADSWFEPTLDAGIIIPARGASAAARHAITGDSQTLEEAIRGAASFPDHAGRLAQLLALRSGDEPFFADEIERLRHLAGQADLGLDVFARVIARFPQLGLPDDWRLPRDPLLDWPRDLGPRPIPEDFGPAHWTPPRTPDWELRNAEGLRIRSHDYRGEPLVQIAYLGFGCQHCIDALNTFEPELSRFYRQDIDFVAIGTDSLKGLRNSLGALNPRDLPTYPMLADRKLRVFREWLAFDEFDHVALHGTWLLDAVGRVLWVETGYQPFEEPVWLSLEAQRLLSSPSPR